MWNLLGMQMIEIHLQEMLHPEATERLAREVSETTIAVHSLNNFAAGLFLLVAGITAQEILFDQPAVQLSWLLG